jgi:hypothetical protein
MTTQKNHHDLTVMRKELSILAAEITNYKRFRIKEAENTLRFARGPKAKKLAVAKLKKVCGECNKLSTGYRHLHIGYGELRGIAREKMEKVVRVDELDEKLLQDIKDRFI